MLQTVLFCSSGCELWWFLRCTQIYWRTHKTVCTTMFNVSGHVRPFSVSIPHRERERHECKQTNAHTHTDAICNCINRDVCVCKTAERYQSGCFSVTTYTHTLVWADFVNTAASRPNYKINIFGISKPRLRPLAHRHTIAHGCRKCATSKPTTTNNQKNVRNNFGHKSPVRAGVEKLADAAGPVWWCCPYVRAATHSHHQGRRSS